MVIGGEILWTNLLLVILELIFWNTFSCTFWFGWFERESVDCYRRTIKNTGFGEQIGRIILSNYNNLIFISVDFFF